MEFTKGERVEYINGGNNYYSSALLGLKGHVVESKRINRTYDYAKVTVKFDKKDENFAVYHKNLKIIPRVEFDIRDLI